MTSSGLNNSGLPPSASSPRPSGPSGSGLPAGETLEALRSENARLRLELERLQNQAGIRAPRSHSQHNLYWSLCQLVAENHPEIRNKEQSSQVIKLMTGHVDVIRLRGQLVQIPRSISFQSMSQDDFQVFWTHVIQVVADELLYLAPETVRAELARRLT